MKHIIIEGGDRLGKSTLIEGLIKHYNYDNVNIRHFGKPPKTLKEENKDPLVFQAKCFSKEAELLEFTRQLEKDEHGYYENIMIWNRSHLGEYVYGQMFRNAEPKELEGYLAQYEINNLLSNPDETFLIQLTADPDFFLKQEDGQSFSQSIEEKTKELKLFDEIFEKSQIEYKLKIKVNNSNKSYFPKHYILWHVLDFLKYKNEL